MNNLERRILEISYKYKLSHIGSCITAVNIIDEIYSIKEEDELFCLSNSHAFLALAVVLEKYYKLNSEELYKKHGTHANRNLDDKIFVSGGSLGHVMPISIGIALSNRKKNVYCLLSDGEMSEGSIWEGLRICDELKLYNLKLYCNGNGWGAYKKINLNKLEKQISGFNFPIKLIKTKINIPQLKGLKGHYIILNEEIR